MYRPIVGGTVAAWRRRRRRGPTSTLRIPPTLLLLQLFLVALLIPPTAVLATPHNLLPHLATKTASASSSLASALAHPDTFGGGIFGGEQPQPRPGAHRCGTPPPLLRSTLARKLACGGLAGAVSRTLTAPVDRVRLLMITAPDGPISMSTALRRATSGPRGALSLWTGNGANCLKITPEMAIKLVGFEYLRRAAATASSDSDGDEDGESLESVSTAKRLVAGGCAGLLAEATVFPLDVVRTRMTTCVLGTYRGIAHCARSVWRGGGPGAFYAGLVPSLVGIFPYAAIDLTVNSILRDLAAARSRARGEAEVGARLLLGCGMVSSATAALATFPVIVIRTQAQATGAGFGQVFVGLRAEGVRGFYRGIVPCLAKVMPANSISYASYEWLNAKYSSKDHVR